MKEGKVGNRGKRQDSFQRDRVSETEGAIVGEAVSSRDPQREVAARRMADRNDALEVDRVLLREDPEMVGP